MMSTTPSDSPPQQLPAPAAPAAPRLLSPLKGPLIGGLLVVLSFVALWWNEARVDQTRFLQRARVVDPRAVDPAAEGMLVAITGPLRLPQLLGDSLLLRPGDYLLLQRRVEIFAWVEERQGDPARGEVEVYRYVRRWTESPRPGPAFRYPEGHDNPPLLIHSERFTAPWATVLAYRFAPELARLPEPRPLPLRPEDLLRPPPGGAAPLDAPAAVIAREEGPAGVLTYLFRGRGSLGAPQLGDVRVSYAAVSSRDTAVVTVFGWQAGDELLPLAGRDRPRAAEPGGPFASFPPAPGAVAQQREESAARLQRAKGTAAPGTAVRPGREPGRPGQAPGSQPGSQDDEEALLRVIPGDRETALAVLESEHSGAMWILRAAGALLLWLGLILLAGPLGRLLSGAPSPSQGPGGSRARRVLHRVALGLSLLLLAALLAALTVVVAVTVHSPALLAAVLGLLFALARHLFRAAARLRGGTAPP